MGAAIDLGLIYAIMALGVFLTYRILNMPDLTVDGSFTTGAGATAILLINGVPAIPATAAGFLAGALAGLLTALLHTRLNIDPLLSSILVMIALYSINLRIMGRANLPLLTTTTREITTLLTPLKQQSLLGTGTSIALLAAGVLAIKFAIDWFMRTNLGLAIQATGDNPGMAASFGVSNRFTKTITLMLANGLAGLSGAIIAQYQGFADISMGIGMILVGLASVIVGNAVLSARHIVVATLGVIVGSILYRQVIYWALKTQWLSANDMKLISAILVVVALVLSSSPVRRNLRRGRRGGQTQRDDGVDLAPEPVPAALDRPRAET